MTTLLLFASVLIVVSLLLSVIFQRRLIYRRGARSADSRLSLESLGGEFLEIETSDGERLEAWHKSPAEGRPIVISRKRRQPRPTGCPVHGRFCLRNLGYWLRTFEVTEDRRAPLPSLVCCSTRKAAYRFCKMRYRPEQIVLWGFSLGSAVAVALASKRKIAALVLEAAFTSLADVAKHWVPFLPVQLVLRDRFRADQAIGSVTTPILMLHGGTDRDIPLELGKRLFESASAPKEFTLLDAGGHDDLDKYGAVAIVRPFSRAAVQQPRIDCPLLIKKTHDFTT